MLGPYWAVGPGRQWKIDEDGLIARSDLDRDAQPSGDWQIVGAVEYNNFGHVVRRWRSWWTLRAAIQASAVPWLYKNGKQRVFILDEDHGHLREWRSPTPYAIR